MDLREVGYKDMEQDYFHSEVLLTGRAAGGWSCGVGSRQLREFLHCNNKLVPEVATRGRVRPWLKASLLHCCVFTPVKGDTPHLSTVSDLFSPK